MSKSLFNLVQIPYTEKINEYVFHNFKLPNKIEFPFSYTHELCHILQFKRNEIDRWNKGYLIFNHSSGGNFVTPDEILPTEPSKTLKPFKRELEVNLINYLYFNNHHKILENNYFVFKFGNKDSARLVLHTMKKYKKRIVKKRLQFVNAYYATLDKGRLYASS